MGKQIINTVFNWIGDVSTILNMDMYALQRMTIL